MNVKIIADSIAPTGKRILTLQLRYPRFIHAEFMTHRVFSRNASSSRAIPVDKIIAQVLDDPAMPVHWGANIPGMQANEQLSDKAIALARQVWLDASRDAVYRARALIALGLHKQVANRILEPWQFINVVVTATEWDNFFELRTHRDAQPEFQVLACAMKEAIRLSQPKQLGYDNWHLPYVTDREIGVWPIEDLIKFSAARCARVSYLRHDRTDPKPEDDFTLYDRLISSKPAHASPIEHQAKPLSNPFAISNNFQGWEQFRATI